MAKTTNKRRTKRVALDREAIVIAADGTWSHNARVSDVSDSGAKLRIYGQFPDQMKSQEFFLVLTPDGRVRRRAKVVWTKNTYLGVGFIGSNRD